MGNTCSEKVCNRQKEEKEQAEKEIKHPPLLKSLASGLGFKVGVNPHLEWSEYEDMLPEVFPVESKQINWGGAANLDDCLEISMRLGSSAIKANKASQKLPLLINLKNFSRDLSEEQKDQGVDLVCLIDASNSLKGTRFESVKKSIKQLLEIMKDNPSRLAIVIFAEVASIYLNFKTIDEESVKKVGEVIDSIGLIRSEPDYKEGLQKAEKLLNQRSSKNSRSAILLLTGEPKKKDIEEWTLASVLGLEVETWTHIFSSFCFVSKDQEVAILQNYLDPQKGGGKRYFLKDSEDLETLVEQAYKDALSSRGYLVKANLTLMTPSPSNQVTDLRFENDSGKGWRKGEDLKTLHYTSKVYSEQTKSGICFLNLTPNFSRSHEKEELIGKVEFKVDSLDVAYPTKTYIRPIKLRILRENCQDLILQDEVVEKELARIEILKNILVTLTKLEKENYDEAEEAIEELSKILEEHKWRDDERFADLRKNVKLQRKVIDEIRNGDGETEQLVGSLRQRFSSFLNEQVKA